MLPLTHVLRRAVAAAAGTVLVLTGLVVPAGTAAADTTPSVPGVPATVSADALPTVQVDGVVWDQVVVGDTVYVAGSFATARPSGAAPGTSTVARRNLLAFDIRTGQLISSWAPTTNAQVRAIEASPDGSRLYIGGEFTQVNGASVWRIAALNRATGALIPSFVPKPDATVRAIAVTADAVYFGGLFNAVGTQTRTRLAAASPSGELLPWAPAAAGASGVNALLVSPDGSEVVVGGSFTSLNGSSDPGFGLGSVDPVTGALLPFAANTRWIRNGGRDGAITHLSGDGDFVYGSGYTFGRQSGTLEGTFAAHWGGGEIEWIEDCHGDTYSAFPVGEVIYQASHKHYCGNQDAFHQTEPWQMRLGTAVTRAVGGTITREPYDYTNFEGNPRPSQLHWYPDMDTGTYTGQNQGPWSVVGTSQYVVMGGEFQNVSGRPQQGLVRFAVPGVAPEDMGPSLSGGKFDLSATSPGDRAVRLRWTANMDPDNEDLTYSLIRNSNTAAPIYQVVQRSRFYDRPTMGYVDKGLTPGATYRYRLRATDPAGNLAWSDTVTVTVSGTATAGSDYAETVLADEPVAHWRLGEASGPWLRDATGWDDLRARAGATPGAPGALAGETDTALALDGSAQAHASTTPNIESPTTFSVEAWIRTTTTQGGRIVGFSSAETGTSSYADRQVYMDNQGRLRFGIRPYSGSRVVASSTQSYNDGQWHHVVGTADAGGTHLYVDGVRVASAAPAQGRMYGGYWRVGGDSLQGWTNRPTNDNFTGDVDEVAVYDRALTHAQVATHLVAAGRTSPLPAPPADEYGAAVAAAEPELYWRLDETSGTAAGDSGAYATPGTFRGAVALGAPGALADGTGTGVRLDGSSARVVSDRSFASPRVYSTELWFSTTTTAGGKLIGLGNNQTGLATSYDRQVVMGTDGRLSFGVFVANAFTNVTTPAAYNDGAWHHVVATQSAQGMRLYVDGELVGENPQSAARSLTGWWKVGGDTTGGVQPYLAGTVDEVAVYSRALSAETVAEHWSLGAGTIPAVPPVASFTATADGLRVDVDGSASSDPDGTVASHAWTFGDGATATGATASHDYAVGGTYDVTLTVTDDSGETASTTQQVTVAAPPVEPAGPFAADAFGRTLPSGWGTADVGGAWSLVGAASAFSVADGVGRMTVPRGGAGVTAVLAGAPSDDADVTARVATTTVANGAGAFFSLIGRRVGANDYRAKVKIAPNGVVTLYLNRVTGAETTLASLAVAPGVSYAAGDALRMRVTVSGTSPSTLQAKVWEDGQPEPADWQLTATDETAALQTAGGVGAMAYLATSTTNAPVTFTVDDLRAAGVGEPQPVENQPPVPAFTHAAEGLGVTFDASGTTDADGTVALYGWDFGDGTLGTGATPTHTYAAGGTYSVTLTATDEDGDAASVTRAVTVAAPPPPGQAPVAAFGVTSDGLSVAVDGAASTDADGTVTGYAWDFGDGTTATGATATHTYAAAGQYTIVLVATDDDGLSSSASQVVTVAGPGPEPAGPLAADDFARDVTGGWGGAATGGAWSLVGAASSFSVAQGAGRMVLPRAGAGVSAFLPGVSSTSTDVRVRTTVAPVADGGGLFVSLVGRRVGAADYRAKVKVAANGSATVYLTRVDGAETTLAVGAVPGVRLAAGEQLHIRLEVTGTSPTTLRTRVWKDGTPEPTTWQLTATDSTAALQAAGGVGLVSYVSASSTTFPLTVTFDDLVATDPSAP
ncbi:MULTISPECIES: PKD domain-containing protein [unclassified Actinotalea]|uniref:PKD domain-containing protein n=1 Tax=unclassified Actinotalea TaxID=2638618 RepID=UPI0015F6E137|nr:MULTISPECIES: PKD domain-containing protein [unclassified Actinotalea]